jgi:hypothetical protein
MTVGKVKESYKAGHFSFKMSIHDETAFGPIDFTKFDNWKKKVPKRSNPVKIRCYIY